MPFAVAPDGIRIYYEIRGKGEPLLLIAGQGSDHYSWNTVPEAFSPQYRAILFDHRGTGLSEKPADPPYSTRGFAADAAAVLDALGLQQAHVYGVSMGGRVAQWFAIDYPERTAALILGCTSPGDAHGVRRDKTLQDAMDRGNNFPLILRTLVSEGWLQADRRRLEWLVQQTPNPTPPFAARLHFLASEAHNVWDRLPEIGSPTLVLHGSEDRLNPTANAPLLADRIPAAEKALIPGARHLYYIEFKEQAAQLVLDFLARHPLRA